MQTTEILPSVSENFLPSVYITETPFHTILQSIEHQSMKPTFTNIEDSVKNNSSISTIASSLSDPLSSSKAFESSSLSVPLSSSEAFESTPTTIPPLNPCALECYINVSFTTAKNSTQLANQINELLSFEFKNNVSKNYLYLVFLKLSAQTNNSVTYWFDLFFQRPYCDSILKQEVLTKSQRFSGKTINGYTILPNSLQIKPFEIPASRNKLLSLEMKLEEDFKKELKNKSSEEYKTLEYKMIRSLSFFMESISGFVKVIINGFEEGSIIVKSQLLFDINEVKVTDEEIKKNIEIKLIRYLGLLNDTIDEYKVDVGSSKINGDLVVIPSSNAFPVWAIVLIVTVLIVVPIIFICFRQKV